MTIKDPHTLVCRFPDTRGVRRQFVLRFATARECSTVKYGIKSKELEVTYGGQIVHEEEAPPDLVAQWQNIQQMLKDK